MSAGVPRLTPDLARWLWSRAGLPNWQRWHHAWGRNKDGSLKLLDCHDCFNEFLSDYSVGRGIKTNDRKDLREHLHAAFKEFASTAPSYDDLERLSKTRIANQQRRSLFSKVAAFAWPEAIVPMDSFNRRGIETLTAHGLNGLSVSKRTPISSLSAFGAAVDVLLADATLADAHLALDPPPGIAPEALRRRLLDLYLTAIGGRWPKPVEASHGARH